MAIPETLKLAGGDEAFGKVVFTAERAPDTEIVGRGLGGTEIRSTGGAKVFPLVLAL